VALKGEVESGMDEWGKQCGGCWFLWSLRVFGYVSVVVEGACVRDCSGLGWYKVLTAGFPAGGENVGGRGSLVMGWGRWAGKVRAWGESG
jgi:hypothetical protein